MSIKIEVTGDSIGEVADKLLAIGASLRGTGTSPIMPEVAEAAKGEPKKRTTKAKDPETDRTSDAASEATQPAGDSDAPSAAGTEPASSGSSTSSTAEKAASPSDAPLDFDKDVAPIVTNAVAKKGKEWVVGVIGQFGAKRASEVPETQWQELIDTLTA